MKPLKCPDGSPFYVFYSNSPTATDRNVYYGSEAGPLYSTTRKTDSPIAERDQVCG